MIYRVTLPNGETLHTGHGPLADVWLNRHGGKLERIPLASIKSVGEQEAPFTCKYCGQPSWIDPSDQSPPPDYCHEIDHGTAEDRTGS